MGEAPCQEVSSEHRLGWLQHGNLKVEILKVEVGKAAWEGRGGGGGGLGIVGANGCRRQGKDDSHLRRTDAKVDNAVGLGQLQHGAVSHDAFGAERHGAGGGGGRSVLPSQAAVIRQRRHGGPVVLCRRYHHLRI